LEGVLSGGVGLEDERGIAAPALRDDDAGVGADDVEPVAGVVAADAELDDGAALHFDLRRREGEALGEDANDPAVLRRSLRRGQRDEQGGAGERAAADATGARHQNSNQSPTFSLKWLPKSVLRLRITE